MRFSGGKQFVVRYIGKTVLTIFLFLGIQRPLASLGRLGNEDRHLAAETGISPNVCGLISPSPAHAKL